MILMIIYRKENNSNDLSLSSFLFWLRVNQSPLSVLMPYEQKFCWTNFFLPWNIKLQAPKELIRNFRIFYICVMCKITNMKTQIEDLSLRLKINVQIICQKLLKLERKINVDKIFPWITLCTKFQFIYPANWAEQIWEPDAWYLL